MFGYSFRTPTVILVLVFLLTFNVFSFSLCLSLSLSICLSVCLHLFLSHSVSISLSLVPIFKKKINCFKDKQVLQLQASKTINKQNLSNEISQPTKTKNQQQESMQNTNIYYFTQSMAAKAFGNKMKRETSFECI